MPFLHELMHRFSGVQDCYHITLAGLDNAGKTSLLYLLKEDRLVTTISTVGYNIETVRPPTLSKHGKATTTVIREGPVEIDLWDASIRGCASAGYFLALHHYAERGDAFIWMVNSAESDRIQDSVDALRDSLERIEKDESEDQKVKQRPLLMYVI